MTEPEALDVIRATIAAAGSQAAFGRRLGLSRQAVHGVLAGHRPPPESILAACGLERVTTVTYRRKRKGDRK